MAAFLFCLYFTINLKRTDQKVLSNTFRCPEVDILLYIIACLSFKLKIIKKCIGIYQTLFLV